MAFASDLLTTLEGAAWEHETIEAEMKKLGEEKGWSVKENFMLLRTIITGSMHSPPLMDSLLVFGKARSIDRVRRFIEAQRKRK